MLSVLLHIKCDYCIEGVRTVRFRVIVKKNSNLIRTQNQSLRRGMHVTTNTKIWLFYNFAKVTTDCFDTLNKTISPAYTTRVKIS